MLPLARNQLLVNLLRAVLPQERPQLRQMALLARLQLPVSLRVVPQQKKRQLPLEVLQKRPPTSLRIRDPVLQTYRVHRLLMFRRLPAIVLLNRTPMPILRPHLQLLLPLPLRTTSLDPTAFLHRANLRLLPSLLALPLLDQPQLRTLLAWLA